MHEKHASFKKIFNESYHHTAYRNQETLFVFALIFFISESSSTIHSNKNVTNTVSYTESTSVIPNITEIPTSATSTTIVDSERLEKHKYPIINTAILIVFSSISAVFLIIYLRFSFKKKGTKTLLHKITCSYCLTLLMFYISLLIAFLLCNFKRKQIASMIVRYFIFSLFAWFLIISGELWLCFIFFRDYKVNYNQSNCCHMTEYFIMCCLAWITPLLVLINAIVCTHSGIFAWSKPFLCFESHDVENFLNNSNLEIMMDFIAKQHVCIDKYKIISFIIFSFVILILGHICYNIWTLISEVDSIGANNSRTFTRHSYMVYAKLSCITGAPWVVSFVLFNIFDNKNDQKFHEIGCIAYSVIISTYGIMISMSLGKKNSSLYGILREHMNRNMIRILPDNISMHHVRIKY